MKGSIVLLRMLLKNINFHHAIIVIAVWLCYHNSIRGQFVFDDVPAIVNNKDIRPETPITNLFKHDYWGHSIKSISSHKSYRPLTVLSFRLNYYFHALTPIPYHITNIILHSIVCLLFYRLYLKLSEIENGQNDIIDTKPLVASLLFAVHPIHTDAVSSIVGRSELFSATFLLLCLLSYMKCIKVNKYKGSFPGSKPMSWKYYTSSMIFSLCAMMSKENGITALAICGIYDILVFVRTLRQTNTRSKAIPNKQRTVISSPNIIWVDEFMWNQLSTLSYRLFIMTTVLSSSLALRYFVMGRNLPYFVSYDNPASHAPSPTRQLTYVYLGALNFWKLLNPTVLSCDWSMNSIPLVKSLYDPRFLATIATYTFITYCCTITIVNYFKCLRLGDNIPSRGANSGWALLIIPFIPASNLFFPVGFVLAERVLYISSMGFCILISEGYHELKAKSKKKSSYLNIGYGMLLMTLTLKTMVRNNDWSSEKSIMRAGICVLPSNAKLWSNLGHCYEEEDKLDVALKHFIMASKKQTDDVGAFINIGRIYQKLKKFKDAEIAYAAAVMLINNEHMKGPVMKSIDSSLASKVGPNRNNSELDSTEIKRSMNRIDRNHKVYYHIPADWLNAYILMGDLISLNKSRLQEAGFYYRTVLNLRSDFALAKLRISHISWINEKE